MKNWQRGQPPNPRHPLATLLGRPDVTLSWHWLIAFPAVGRARTFGRDDPL